MSEGAEITKAEKLAEYLKFGLQYIVMPIVLVWAGWAVNGRVAQQHFEQELAIKTREIESSYDLKKKEMESKLFKEIFSEDTNPSLAFMQTQIVIDIVDKETAETIKKTVVNHFRGFLELSETGNIILTKQTIKIIDIALPGQRIRRTPTSPQKSATA